jgi:hypothetical protein
MSYIPMHNRFAEGFVEPESSGETVDPLSSQIRSAPLAAADFDEVLRRALSARDAALAAALVRVGRSLASVLVVPARWLIVLPGVAAARTGRRRAPMPPTSTRWPISACAGPTFPSSSRGAQVARSARRFRQAVKDPGRSLGGGRLQ